MMIQHASLGDARILVVDDVQANIQLLERILRQNSYTNIRALTDSREVLGTYVAWEPDLVLLDLHMPHLDGFAVLQQLSTLPHAGAVPVLVLTADITPDVRQRALALGAKDFVAKPFDITEVVLRIKNLLETRFLYVRLQQHSGHLERQVRARTRALEAAQLEIVDRLARAAEYRDDATGEHIRRVGELSAQIAAAYGLSATDVALIRHAAPLHDIGKLGIPDHILLKPGRLTFEERAQMQTHTTIGARLLSRGSSSLVQVAEQIALRHHERWDGTGYPHGLRGDNIPLVGRIVAIADVFDALRSSRPYKPAWPVEHALDEIKRQRGRQFDPHLVELFLQVHDVPLKDGHRLDALTSTSILQDVPEHEMVSVNNGSF
jgi:putative two-component system response regulator